MASTAVSAQGTTVHIATGSGGAKSITAVAVGFPTILTAAAHGFGNGDVVALAALTGANAATLNGLSPVVKNRTANTFAVEVDTTGMTITAGAGTATPTTYTPIKNVKTFSGFDGAASEIDITNLDSTGMENRPGLVDSGQIAIEVDQDDTDTGQIAVRTAKDSGLTKSFKLILPNGKVLSCNGWVKKFATQGAVNGVVKASIDIRLTGLYTIA